MTKIRSTKNALISAILVLCMAFTGLLGTTFAWFTDSVTSSGNKIVAGTLKVDLELMDKNGNWNSLKGESKPIFDENAKWEPGYTEIKLLKIENEGSLALTWMTVLTKYEEISALAEVIDVYVRDYGVLDDAAASELTYPQYRNLAGYTLVGTAAEFLSTLSATTKGTLEAGQSAYLGLALKMRTDAGNEYQGLSLGGTFDITVLATQMTGESDSFDDIYDDNAAPDFFPGFQGGHVYIPVTSDSQGLTAAAANGEGGDVSAVIPTGVKLADGVSTLELTAYLKDDSTSNVTLGETEIMRPIDVHIEGIADDNTTPMLITLENYMPTGLNMGALKLYHVENGATVAMTHTATPTNHNEFYYDPLTGNMTIALASFSEVTAVADTTNPWNGRAAVAFAGGDGSEGNPYLIASADQLAYFRDLVDNGDSFEGKTVKLNNNIYLDGKLFDPIGWGYVNTTWNRDGAAGKVFQGTFDGNGKTIFGLYQSGWDLEESTKTDYTYTNCGFGLFAAASNATFKNLTISGAYVRVECVEAGVLVGLSQNNCTYENIEIHDSKIANYQRPAGGLIGEVSGDGTTTITNVTIGSDVVVGSLWGDFDAPVGGVIGARWDDVNANPQIVMTNVEVGARLDVYNDITSAYQWHAYRRAGMLIGNTDMSDPENAHKADAPFLTCTKDAEGNGTVKVYYGDWVNYTYCSFSNHNSRYPWVRTQAGENCEAFSNPRWGVPNDANGKYVTDMNHVHKEGDECNVSRPFGQLYGGGQGVYGKDTHDGVEVINYKYSITYINDGKVLDIIYVTDNSKAYTVANDQAQKLVEEWATKNMTAYENWQFGGWMNAGSTKLTEIPANNPKNVVLYPYFDTPYTASFVDQRGNIIAWCFFNKTNTDDLVTTEALAKSKLIFEDGFTFDYWEVHVINDEGKIESATKYGEFDFSKCETDVTIYPYYLYKGVVNMIPVDEDNDGDTDYYQVNGSNISKEAEDIIIPDYVNGVPVKIINSGAFDDGRLRDVYVPNTITEIGKNAFCKDTPWEYPQIQIIFDGTKAEWDAITKTSNWDDNIGENSVIVCTKEPNGGYYKKSSSYSWGKWNWVSGSFPDWYPRTEE